ncbi:hypothetical protein [uncultured Gimesia sp.]|uniref:hypothetical protein n=1 Tax=uncultured Gimesia sp. TaxID=1678688 RepID=UPI0030DCA2A3|tara:strand:- start:15690 stop:16694 length:1005 start_codon:yes stop_codon:yes gene_type:complete
MKYDVQKFIILTLILVLFPIPVPASEPDEDVLQATKPQSATITKKADGDRWHKLLNKWKSERDRLKSGRVTIKGDEVLLMNSRSESGETIEKQFRRSFQLQGDFDYELGFQKWVASNFGGYNKINCKCLFAPDGITTWCSNSEPNTRPKHINIWDLDAKLPSYAIYWYPLSAGFSKIYSGGKIPDEPYGLWYKILRKRQDANSNETIDFSTDKASGLTRVKIKAHSSVNNRPCIIINDLLFNEQQGCTLKSHTLWIYPQEIKQPKHPFSDVRVEWDQISGVWVPTSVSRSSSGSKRTRDLKLNWDAINEPVDANIFLIGAPENTIVVDLRQNTK